MHFHKASQICCRMTYFVTEKTRNIRKLMRKELNKNKVRLLASGDLILSTSLNVDRNTGVKTETFLESRLNPIFEVLILRLGVIF